MVLGQDLEDCVFKEVDSHILYTIKMILSRGGGVSSFISRRLGVLRITSFRCFISRGLLSHGD